jgi:hypothetical protein
MPESESDDLYDALQVSPRADLEVIEAAYRALARRYHPDRDPSPGATARMARINHAWDVLGQPESRAAYDRERFAPRIAVAAGAPDDQPEERVASGPRLTIAPERLVFSRRRGESRTAPLTVYTDPPGIRVDAAVTAGAGWLAVAPATLRGLDQESVTVTLRSRGLAAGLHQGAVTLATSWERRTLVVDAQVQRASLLLRLRLWLARLARRAVLLPALVIAVVAALLAVLLLLSAR